MSLLVPHQCKVVLGKVVLDWCHQLGWGKPSWTGVGLVRVVLDWLDWCQSGCVGVALVVVVLVWLDWCWSGWTGVGLVVPVLVWLRWSLMGGGRSRTCLGQWSSKARGPECIKQISSAGKALFLIMASLKRGLHYPMSFYTKIQQQHNLLIQREGDKPL